MNIQGVPTYNGIASVTWLKELGYRHYSLVKLYGLLLPFNILNTFASVFNYCYCIIANFKIAEAAFTEEIDFFLYLYFFSCFRVCIYEFYVVVSSCASIEDDSFGDNTVAVSSWRFFIC